MSERYRVVITPTGDRLLSWEVSCYAGTAMEAGWTTFTHRGAVRSGRRWIAAKTLRDRRMQRPPEVLT